MRVVLHLPDSVLHFHLNHLRTLLLGPDLGRGCVDDLLSVGRRGGEDVDALLDDGSHLLLLHALVRPHPHLEEHVLAPLLHLTHALHRPQRLRHELAVVSDRSVPSLLKLEGGVLLIE